MASLTASTSAPAVPAFSAFRLPRRCSGVRRVTDAVVRATLVGPEKMGKAARQQTRKSSFEGRKAQIPIGVQQTKPINPLAIGGKEVEERAMRLQIETHLKYPNGRPELAAGLNADQLDEAYERCRYVTSEYAKTFYLGTTLMSPEKAKAIWAIYVWCRRTDELVDGPNSSRITPEVCPGH